MRDILTAVTVLQWAMVAVLLLAVALCWLALVGLRGDADLPRRPLPLPGRKPARYEALHAMEGPTRPMVPSRVAYLDGVDTQGISIWSEVRD